MYCEDDFLALSGIQHFSFCRRQWALIHIERLWTDNLLTVQGELLHERAHDEAIREHRGDTIVVRNLTVQSSALGVSGKCDVVEFHRDEEGHPLVGEDGLWRAMPVEYKRGKTKVCDCDRLQLCAQAMCLEEMLGAHIERACLYYGATHSREEVILGKGLRSAVKEAFGEMHRLYDRRHVPKVRQSSACRSCSLHDQCVPKSLDKSVDAYIQQAFLDMGDA